MIVISCTSTREESEQQMPFSFRFFSEIKASRAVSADCRLVKYPTISSGPQFDQYFTRYAVQDIAVESIKDTR